MTLGTTVMTLQLCLEKLREPKERQQCPATVELAIVKLTNLRKASEHLMQNNKFPTALAIFCYS